jgi:colanic acid/amylovoran biosynthesis glycosyltransferase
LVLARSESLVKGLIELGCPPEKIRIHRTGIPLGELPFTQREAPTDGEWKLVQACRLIPKKGIHTSIRAYSDFSKAFPKATFTIAGEGPMLGELQDFCAEQGVKVNFPGFLSQDALRELYSKAHLFLHPSQIGNDGNQEGVPNAMLEAMAMGIPVLATRHGGIPEAVEDNVSGILVEECDSVGLSRRMLQLAHEPAAYHAMSRAANQAVSEKFEQGRQISALEGFYAETLKN